MSGRTHNQLHCGDLPHSTLQEHAAVVRSSIGQLHIGDPQREVSVFQLSHDEAGPVVEGWVLHLEGLAATAVQEDQVWLQAFFGPLDSRKLADGRNIETARQNNVSSSKGQNLLWLTVCRGSALNKTKKEKKKNKSKRKLFQL